MSVTVSDLLKLPSLQHARVIGGAGGLKKVVSSISVLESTDPGVLINEVFRHNKYPGSEIVITGFLNCINDVECQCSNLLRLIEGGEVGMVLYYVGVYLPRVDRRLIEIADANDFVLICMPEGQRHLRYSDLITDVTECIYKDRLVPGSLVSDILARISSAPHHQQTVGTALQMLCAELGCSAALTTHEGNILNLATWPSGMEDTVREGIERCLQLLTEQICVPCPFLADAEMSCVSIRSDLAQPLHLALIKVGAPLGASLVEQAADIVRICINIWGIEERDANRSVRFRTEILSVSWPETLYNIVVNDTECQVGEVRVNYKHQVEVEVHPALSCVSYKQIYIDGQLVEEEELNRDSYKAASGLIYRASDCNVSASVRPGNAGEAMVFPYIGWTIDISVTTLGGEDWPYYE